MIGRAPSRWPPVLLGAFATFTVLAVAIPLSLADDWQVVGVGPMSPDSSFADLRQITATADCVAVNPDWQPDNPNCDPWARAYNYPIIWARAFAAFGWGEAQTDVIGMSLLVGFAVAVGLVGWLAARGARITSWSIVVYILAVASPATWLLLARGNTDSIMFLALAIACIFAVRGWWILWGGFIATAAGFKLFPIAASVGGVAKGTHAIWWTAGTVVVSGLVISANLADVLRSAATTPQSTGASFGAAVIPAVLIDRFPPLEIMSPRLWGWVIFAGSVVAIWAARRLRIAPRMNRGMRAVRVFLLGDPTALLLAATGGSIALLAYIFGTSYDYRGVFLIMAVAGLVRRNGGRDAISVILLAVLWLSYPFPGWLQLLGDALWALVTPLICLLLCDVLVARMRTPDRPTESVEV